MSNDRPFAFSSTGFSHSTEGMRVDAYTQTEATLVDTEIKTNMESNVGANENSRFTTNVFSILAPAITRYGPTLVLEMLRDVFYEDSPPSPLEKNYLDATLEDSSESTQFMSSPGSSGDQPVYVHNNILFGAEESVSSRVDGHENETTTDKDKNKDKESVSSRVDGHESETLEGNEASRNEASEGPVNRHIFHRHNLFRLGRICPYLWELLYRFGFSKNMIHNRMKNRSYFSIWIRAEEALASQLRSTRLLD